MSKPTRVTRAIDLGISRSPVIKITKHLSVSSNGLFLAADARASRAEWAQAGELLRTVTHGGAFALGDFVLLGEQQLGDDIWQIVDQSAGWSEETIRNYRWIANSIPASIRRMDKLTVRHHQLVAKMEREQQEHWLNLAADDEDGPWTVNRLREAIAGEQSDIPPKYFVLIEFATQMEQETAAGEWAAKGHAVKQITSRKRKKQEEE